LNPTQWIAIRERLIRLVSRLRANDEGQKLGERARVSPFECGSDLGGWHPYGLMQVRHC
jgi:hypothetical protein